MSADYFRFFPTLSMDVIHQRVTSVEDMRALGTLFGTYYLSPSTERPVIALWGAAKTGKKTLAEAAKGAGAHKSGRFQKHVPVDQLAKTQVVIIFGQHRNDQKAFDYYHGVGANSIDLKALNATSHVAARTLTTEANKTSLLNRLPSTPPPEALGERFVTFILTSQETTARTGFGAFRQHLLPYDWYTPKP